MLYIIKKKKKLRISEKQLIKFINELEKKEEEEKKVITIKKNSNLFNFHYLIIIADIVRLNLNDC